MLSGARAVERSCAHRCRHLSLVWPDRPTMGATMAKPRARPRPLTLEVRFEAERGGWEILGRAYQRQLPLLVRSASSKSQKPGNEGAMRAQHLRAIPLPAPLQAAIYARVSSDQQAERHTINSQLAD